MQFLRDHDDNIDRMVKDIMESDYDEGENFEDYNDIAEHIMSSYFNKYIPEEDFDFNRL